MQFVTTNLKKCIEFQYEKVFKQCFTIIAKSVDFSRQNMMKATCFIVLTILLLAQLVQSTPGQEEFFFLLIFSIESLRIF